MKKILIAMLALCLLLCGCKAAGQAAPATEAAAQTTAAAETEAPGQEQQSPVYPLPDNTLNELDNCTVAVGLQEGFLYQEDGRLMMNVELFGYELFDMVDIARLEVGSIIVLEGEEVVIEQLQKLDSGAVQINGGLDAGGYDLVSQDNGVFYQMGYSDAKSWYHMGITKLPVGENFLFTDSSDLDKGTVEYTAQQLLAGEGIYFDFQPGNTTIRVEAGEVVAMERVYIP